MSNNSAAPVSVIIPTHNREKFLPACIESVLAQTLEPLEIIVVDDGSTDSTERIVAGFGEKIRYLKQSQMGVSAARNTGIRNAKGGWIALLDSDDRWAPDKIEEQLRYLESHPGIFLIQSEEIWIRNGVRVNAKKTYRKPSGWIFNACIPVCAVSPSTVLIHRSVFDTIGLFDEALPACEDYDFWLRAALRFEIANLPKALTIKYGGHVGQLSNQPGLDRYRVRALLKILEDPAINSEQTKIVWENIAHRSRVLAQGCAKRGNTPEALEYRALHEKALEESKNRIKGPPCLL